MGLTAGMRFLIAWVQRLPSGLFVAKVLVQPGY